MHFEILYNEVGKEYSNPFPEQEREIKQDMFVIHHRIMEAIKILSNGFKELNCSNL